MAAPRKYSLELRERAVRMYRTTEPRPQIKKLAVDLGVSPIGVFDFFPLVAMVAVTLGAGNTLFTVALRTSVPNLVGAADRLLMNLQLVRILPHSRHQRVDVIRNVH